MRLTWINEIIEYLAGYFNFPALDLPKIDAPHDFREIDTEFLEAAADVLRSHWRIGKS